MLSTTDSYKVLSITKGGIESGNACSCDNCGRLIVNMASIQNQQGVKYIVGLDCVKKLVKRGFDSIAFEQMEYEFLQCVKFMTHHKKATYVNVDDTFVSIVYLEKGKSKVDSAFKHVLLKYGFAF